MLQLALPYIISLLGGYITHQALTSDKQVIKQRFDELVDKQFKISKLEYTNYGYKAIIECINDGNYDMLESFKPTFNKIFQAQCYTENIRYSNKILLDIVTNKSEPTYNQLKLSPYHLLLGYNHKHEPIIVNMKITPHMGVVGISNNGKSKCIEQAFKNRKDIEVHILNSMENDFKGIGTKRLNNEFDILDYLYYITHDTTIHYKPLYIILDEYNVISNLNGLDQALEDLLRQARHRNVFLIVLMQQATKDECNFKNLFNVRVCFKQIGTMQYYSFLGTTIDETMLKQREFICLHEKLEYGKSYYIKS